MIRHDFGDVMTKRERILAFIRFEPVDRVPRFWSLTEGCRLRFSEYLGEDPQVRFDLDTGVAAELTPPEGYEPPDYSGYFPEYEVGKDGFTIDGNGCGHKQSGFHHFSHFISPLRDADSFSELENYPYPDNSGWTDEAMRATAVKAHADGNFTSVFAGLMYESAWQVRGYEQFLMDLMTQRDWAEYILDRFAANSLRTAVAAASAGHDCIRIGDDIASQNALMFPPELWRETMKVRWARVIAAARAIKPDIHVWYHTDGNAEAVLDDLVEIGIDILNPVQPECMDPIAIRKRFGKRLAFDGCIGTQTTFPYGTVQDMHRMVRELGEALDARNGGVRFAPTHFLEPDVPPENIMAFFEACDSLLCPEFNIGANRAGSSADTRLTRRSGADVALRKDADQDGPAASTGAARPPCENTEGTR